MPDEHFLTPAELAARKAAKAGIKQAGQEAPKPADAPATPPPPAAPAKFKFGGAEWDTQEQAEQSFRTLRGQYRSLEQRASNAEASANQFQQAFAAQTQRLAALEQAYRTGQPLTGQPGQPGAPGAPAAPEAAPSKPKSVFETLGVDLQAYTSIAQNQGLDVAAAWLAGQVAEKQGAALEAKFTEMVKPFAQYQEHLGNVQKAQTVFDQVANYAELDPQTGEPTYGYPELQDPQAAGIIGTIWKNLPLAPEARFDPRGIVAAVALFRSMYPGASSAQQATTTHQPSAPSSVGSEAAAAAAQVAQAVLGGAPRGTDAVNAGSPPHVRPTAAHAGFDVAAFRRGIDSASVPSTQLGFSR